MPTRPGAGAAALAVLAALAVPLGWAPVAPAAAHDELLTSDPSQSGVVDVLPSRAVLTFTGPVSEVHDVSVTGPDGSVVNGEPTSVGTEVRQNLWAGPDGAYTMTYEVVSADGHEITGEVQFQVGAGAEPGVDEASAPTSAEAGEDDGLGGVLLPGAVVLAGGAVALVLWHRRRAVAGS
ncbi:copper resistance CopC family protein [Nocardioides xinjiangensis]|uniref:copper resistance CopC family protein n=1 Tax=Nocardioides xinjiangensis TaxID=2817376 RepID=UPI001B312FA6|nr:copper resistance CopC family protein [Nocardioides sp. SYSU D00514]